ncbi:MAG: adenosylcobinamide-GDP ribazoletransferase [Nitrospiraceae bacterium]
MLRSFVIAWHFLTIVPLIDSHHNPAPGELAQSMRWFPLVGVILGGLLAVTDFMFSRVFPDGVTNLLLIALLVVVTGGLHLDGLADSLDGLAGGRTPAERLAIMRDPCIGAIGATGLFLVLGLRYTGLLALPPSERVAWLVCMPVVGRWAMVVGAMSAPYARTEGGLAQPFLQQLSARAVIVSTLLAGGVLLWGIGPWKALSVCALFALVARAVTVLARRLLGGITGDTLGATNEIAEVCFLIIAPFLAGTEPALLSP